MSRAHSIPDPEIEELRAAIREQRADIREYLDGEGVNVCDWGEDSHETVSDADREPTASD